MHTPPSTCTGSPQPVSPDAVYFWTAPYAGTFNFDTVGSDFDTILTVRSGSCAGAPLGCNDDIDSGNVASRLVLPLSAGQTVVLAVDGYGAATGNFAVNIARADTADAGVPDAGPACSGALSACGGRCVDTSNDAAHCGACGVTCSARCVAGRCAPPTWTVFVYGHADHNLSRSLVRDLEEMSRATLNSNVNVVVMADWDASGTISPDLASTWNRIIPASARTGGVYYPTGSQWFRVPGSGQPLELIMTAPEQNLDDPSVMTEAVRVALSRYPADRYGIVFWDHGGSWETGFGGDDQNSYNLTTPRYGAGIGIQSIAGAIRTSLSLSGLSGRSFEFIAFDTCLLGSVETAYPLRGLAQVLLAEAEVDFGDGWDYSASLTRIASSPSISARDFARGYIADWSAHHRRSVPDRLIRSAVAVDLNRMDALATAARTFTNSLLTDPMMSTPAIARAAVLSAPTYRPSFSPGSESGHYRDLGQVLDAISGLAISTPTRTALNAFSAALSFSIIASDQGGVRQLAGQRGLQVALPEWNSFGGGLEGVYRMNASEWSGASRWSELISAMAPGSIPSPMISATWSNTINADGLYRPRVSYFASSQASSAYVTMFQVDLSAPDVNFPYRLMGIVESSTIIPGAPYQYEWDGTRMELPDGQPLTIFPFIRSYDPGTMSSIRVESAVGMCSGWGRPFSCALLWQGDLQVILVADITRPSSPDFYLPADLLAGGFNQFTPIYIMQSSDGRARGGLGRTFFLPTTGNLTLARRRSSAGAYEITIGVRDVYGRTASATRGFTTRVAYGP